MRQVGWYLRKLRDTYELKPELFTDLGLRQLVHYYKFRGIGRQALRSVLLLCEYNKKISWRIDIINNSMIFSKRHHFLNTLLSFHYDFQCLQHLYLLKKYLTRRYSVRRNIAGYPGHGQRTWSNASTVRRSFAFFRSMAVACTVEVLGYKRRKVLKWSKLLEMRAKAKVKPKKMKKIRYHKFKKKGEKKLKTKRRRKKSLWK